MADERIYVVLYCDEEGTHLLWAGVGQEVAVKAVNDCRAGIEEAQRAKEEILGRYNPIDWDKVTDAEWAELNRRRGPFRFYSDPERVCVQEEVVPFDWDCCCDRLGVGLDETILY